MKKPICVLLAAVLSAAVISGCTENEPDSTASKTESKAVSSVDTSVAESSEASPEESSQTEQSEPVSESDSSSKAEEKPLEMSEYAPAMWTVSDDKGHEITLLGSMHALTEEDYPLPAEITKRYDAADVLAVECDITSDESTKLGLSLMKEAYYKDGTTIKDHISEEAYEILSSYLADTQYDLAMFEKLKTWMIESLVEEVGMEASGLDSGKGIDRYLLTQAHESGKEIYEVESVEFQIDMLMGFSDEIYDMTFRSLEDYTPADYASELIKLHDAWRVGDLEGIEGSDDEMTEDISAEDQALLDEYNKAMLDDRNEGMEECIKEMLSDGENVFFVVGAAHYVGEKGIIALLENDGYKVERVVY